MGTEIIIPSGPSIEPPTITTIMTNMGCNPTESEIIKGEDIRLSINCTDANVNIINRIW